jgi:hypothetical protein
MGGNALTPSGVSHFFRGCCLDVDGLRGNVATAGKVGLHRGEMRRQFGALADDGNVGVAQKIMPRSSSAGAPGQEQQAVDSAVLLVGVRKMAADVTLAQSAEQGVGQGMGHDIGVGVAVQAPFIVDGYPAENQLAAGNQPVGIKTVSYFHGLFRGQQGGSHLQIFRSGDFEIALAARDHPHRDSRGLEQ